MISACKQKDRLPNTSPHVRGFQRTIENSGYFRPRYLVIPKFFLRLKGWVVYIKLFVHDFC